MNTQESQPARSPAAVPSELAGRDRALATGPGLFCCPPLSGEPPGGRHCYSSGEGWGLRTTINNYSIPKTKGGNRRRILLLLRLLLFLLCFNDIYFYYYLILLFLITFQQYITITIIIIINNNKYCINKYQLILIKK